MPTERRHLDRANHNQGLLDELLPQVDRFPDWVATIAFYKAIHVVEAMFACETPAFHSQSHVERDSHLKLAQTVHIYRHYARLKEVASIARYMDAAGDDFAAYTAPGMVRDDLIGIHLRSVEELVEDLLNTKKILWPAVPILP